MVKAFARKTERPTLSPGTDEFDLLRTPDVNEISPASLWSLEDEAPAQSKSPDGKQHLELDQPGWIEVSEADDLSDLQSETAWWTKPDLSEASAEIKDAHLGSSVPQTPEVVFTPIDISSEDVEADVDPPEDSNGHFSELASDAVASEPEAPTNDPNEAAMPERLEAESITASNQPVESQTKVHARPRILDESAVLPHEVSYATVVLNQEAPRRPRLLDESVVLPHEVSYATVVLNQKAPRRPRLLDESVVLPHEVSFATVALDQSSPRPSYSPTREFAEKFTLRLKKAAPVMLVILIFAGAIAFSLKFKSDDGVAGSTRGIRNSSIAPAAPRAKTPIPQEQAGSEATARSHPDSDTPKETARPNPIVESQPVAAKVAADASPKVESLSGNEPILSGAAENLQPGLKRAPAPIKRPKAAAPKAQVDDAPVQQPSEKRTVTTENADTKSQSKPEARAVPSGGGERPRRVTPDANTNTSSGAPPPKPKVIDWP